MLPDSLIEARRCFVGEKYFRSVIGATCLTSARLPDSMSIMRTMVSTRNELAINRTSAG